MIDPDTKESLGPLQLEIGKVRVVKVNPKTSIAEVVQVEIRANPSRSGMWRRASKSPNGSRHC